MALAKSTCAEYGKIPWHMQEKVSRMLAVRALGILNRAPIFLAIGPIIKIEMVFIAIAAVTKKVIKAILNSALRRELIL